MTLKRPNSGIIAAAIALVFGASALGGVLYKTFAPAEVRAGAEYAYASEPQWYNGPVAHPVLSGNNMAFITLWEGNGLNLYMTDLFMHKDAKITISQPLTAQATLPSVSDNYLAWTDNRNNKYQVTLFERFSYESRVITDSMNEIGRPALDGAHVVWTEANGDQFGAQLRSYEISSTNIETLAAGAWMSNPVVAGSRVAWFQTSAACNSLAYRVCRPDGAAGDVMVYNRNVHSVQKIASNVVVKFDPTMTETRVIWTQKFGNQYDLVQYEFSTGVTTRLTNTEATEAYPVTASGRVVFIGIPASGYPRRAHALDLSSGVDTVMPYKGFNQEFVTTSGNRVAWQEVRKDSRIYIYDFSLPEQTTDVDADGLSTGQENSLKSSDMNKDSDGDGIPDTDEVVLYGTNPSAVDSDGDGLNDYEELFYYKTNPVKFDTDGDSYNDGVEIMNNYSPLNPKPQKIKAQYEWSAKARPLSKTVKK